MTPAVEKHYAADALRRLAAEQNAHDQTGRSLAAALLVLACLTVLLLVMSFKYLHMVNAPARLPVCPMHFTPTEIELAPVADTATVRI